MGNVIKPGLLPNNISFCSVFTQIELLARLFCRVHMHGMECTSHNLSLHGYLVPPGKTLCHLGSYFWVLFESTLVGLRIVTLVSLDFFMMCLEPFPDDPIPYRIYGMVPKVIGPVGANP